MAQRIQVDDETVSILKTLKNSMSLKNYNIAVRVALAALLHSVGQVQHRHPDRVKSTPHEVLQADKCMIDKRRVWTLVDGDLDIDPGAARAVIAARSEGDLWDAIRE